MYTASIEFTNDSFHQMTYRQKLYCIVLYIDENITFSLEAILMKKRPC